MVVPGCAVYTLDPGLDGVEAVLLSCTTTRPFFEEMIEPRRLQIRKLERRLILGQRLMRALLEIRYVFTTRALAQPRHFKKYMSPHYRRISDLLDATGGHRWVDCVGISKSSSPSAESASMR